MKLYRGLKGRDVQLYSPAVQRNVWDSWSKLLQKRTRGDFSYPSELDVEVLSLEKLGRLSYQHFSDDERTAHAYAKQENGVVIEIDVPLSDIKKYFTLEFQNFSKRKKSFEIVYIVRGADLHRSSKKWKIKIKKP
jgi:hypothetical protein